MKFLQNIIWCKIKHSWVKDLKRTFPLQIRQCRRCGLQQIYGCHFYDGFAWRDDRFDIDLTRPEKGDL